jgi:hypothetical protein
MPLRDHFHRPARGPWPWTSVHSTWATCIVQALNQTLLPQSHFAIPTLHLSAEAQVDVATVEKEDQVAIPQDGNGAVATAVWAPPLPPVTILTNLADLDVIEIEVRNREEGFSLVAAIELVSPANKDRSSHRNAFTAKCAAYLQQGIGLVIVDIVTDRRSNLHAGLMELLELDEDPRSLFTSDLYAVAYRAVGSNDAGGPPRLEMWPNGLQVGANLPVVPLWITSDRAIPLDLEATYTATCQSLRMP